MNNLGKLLVFFLEPSLYVSFEWHQTKVPASLSLSILDSWFIIEYHFHPIVHMPWLTLSNFIFIILFISAGFYLAFIYEDLISFNQFLTVLSKILTPVSNYLCFICYTFSIFKVYCFQFSILTLCWLLCSTSMFTFFNHLISLIFVQNFTQLTWNNQCLSSHSIVS